mgnify:CR=1 FL=1
MEVASLEVLIMTENYTENSEDTDGMVLLALGYIAKGLDLPEWLEGKLGTELYTELERVNNEN